jgi:hypothetical protein
MLLDILAHCQHSVLEHDDRCARSRRSYHKSTRTGPSLPSLCGCESNLSWLTDQAIEVDDIEVVFQDTDGNDVIFRVGSAVLSPGVNKLQAHCIVRPSHRALQLD